MYNINYSTGKTARNLNLTKFRNNNTKINIMLNVHILDEGIDIPECDSIYLTHPNNNPINLIQRISRANRIHKNKTTNIANILVWSKNQEKLNDIIKRIKIYIPVKSNNINNEFINDNFQTNIQPNIQPNLESENIIINTLNKINIIKYLKNNNVKDELINFFDTYFNFYDEKIKNTDFTINLDLLTVLLNARKGSIKETLIKSYTKNIDYKILLNNQGKNGRPSDIIILTNDCAKRLCMLSKTIKATKIRSYFIDLEKHINQYKNCIIEKYIVKHTAT